MSAANLLARVAEVGGAVWLEEGRLKFRLPEDHAEILKELRTHKSELLEYLSCEPEPEATLTAWDLLRADFTNLLETGLDPEDARGSITVIADGPTGMVIGCNLRERAELAGHCRMLKEKYPNPLEIRISAQHDQTMHLRSRHTLAMVLAREGIEWIAVQA